MLFKATEEYLKIHYTHNAVKCLVLINEAYPTLLLDNLLKAFGIKELALGENIAEIQYELAWALCYENKNIKFCNDMLLMCLLEKAANHGTCAKAMKLYGGYNDTLEKTYLWYQRAAKAGDAETRAAITFFHCFERGIEPSFETILEWQNIALSGVRQDLAEQSLAQYYAGMECFQKYVKNPHCNLQKLQSALDYFEKSAATGNLFAKEALAYGHQNGFFCRKAGKATVNLAIDNGSTYCILEENFREAYRLYHEAQELPFAQYNLAVLCFSGKGVKKNYREACGFYKKAWNAKVKIPHLGIAVLFARGVTTTGNHSLAIECFDTLSKSSDQSVATRATKYKQLCVPPVQQTGPALDCSYVTEKSAQHVIPAVANWDNSTVIEVHLKNGRIFYRVGRVEEQGVVWTHSIDTQIEGQKPSVVVCEKNQHILVYEKDGKVYLRREIALLTTQASVLSESAVIDSTVISYALAIDNEMHKLCLVYQPIQSNRLYYMIGNIEESRISWGEAISYDCGKNPSIAFYHHGDACMLVEAHEHPKRNEIYYNIGKVVGNTVIWEERYYADRLVLGCNPKLVSADKKNELFMSYRACDGQALVATTLTAKSGRSGKLMIPWNKKPFFFAAGANAAIALTSTQSVTSIVAISEVENKLFSSTIGRVNGLQHRPILEDGHCMYRAIICHLKNGEDIPFLRSIVAAKLESNKEQYIGLVPLGNNTFSTYVDRIRNTNELGGKLEINILMKLLNRPIVILDSNGKILNEEAIGRYLEGDPIFVYYNSIAHYDAIIVQDGYNAKDILARLLKPNHFAANMPVVSAQQTIC